jgi:tetratricopeptide (TPR) repeat protein
MGQTIPTIRRIGLVGVMAACAWAVPADERSRNGWNTPEHERDRIQVETLLAEGKFREAREAAATLNRKIPDDIRIYALLAEAQIELQEFEDAEKNVDWMFRLRPPEPAGLWLGARLREVFGDVPGALEFLGKAFSQLAPADQDLRERILLTTISIETRARQFDLAQKHLALLPDSPRKAAALQSLDAAIQAKPKSQEEK